MSSLPACAPQTPAKAPPIRPLAPRHAVLRPPSTAAGRPRSAPWRARRRRAAAAKAALDSSSPARPRPSRPAALGPARPVSGGMGAAALLRRRFCGRRADSGNASAAGTYASEVVLWSGLLARGRRDRSRGSVGRRAAPRRAHAVDGTTGRRRRPVAAATALRRRCRQAPLPPGAWRQGAAAPLPGAAGFAAGLAGPRPRGPPSPASQALDERTN